MLTRRGLIIGTLSLLLTILWGYSPAPLAQVRVIKYGTPSPYQPPYQAAIEYATKTLKEKEGIQLQMVKHRGFTATMASLLRGDILLAYFPVTTLTNSLLQGAKVKAFLGFLQHNQFVLVGPKSVKGVRDFKGKTLAAHARGSMTDIGMQALLAQEGLKVGKDYKMIFVTGTPTRVAALMAGSIAGSTIDMVAAYQLERETKGKYKILKGTYEAEPTMSVSVWVARTDRLSKDRKLLTTIARHLLRSYRDLYGMGALEAANFAKSHKLWAIRGVQDLSKVFEKYAGMEIWPKNGGMTEENWRKGSEFVLKYGLIDKKISFEKVADLSILKQLLAEEGRAK